jgi:hypothetical protein
MLRNLLRATCILAALLTGAVCALAADAPKATFTEDVAPILMKRCVSCHHPGEIAPMSLLTYDDVRPWAKSIREAVLTRKMPPWQADTKIGHFSNDISLSDREIDTIVRWVDHGAARGNPSKMPAAPRFNDGWKLGEPDYVLDMGKIDVPASGPDLFLDRHVQLDLPEDRWVRAVEIQIGNRKVLHHLVTFLGVVEMSGSDGQRPRNPISPTARILSVWAAGTPPTVFPEGMGHPVAKNQDLTFNIHLHPGGEAASDHSKVGIYFGKGKLEKTIRTGLTGNPGILIPAGADNVGSSASYVFGSDTQIISLFPHMHLRGKDMSYTLTYPDGRRETVLSVPRYDFNWQWLYYPEKHLEVPRGTRLDVTAHWDNSASNRNNPDPKRTVEFGEGTDSEMLVGFFEFIVNDTKPPMPPRDRVDLLLATHSTDASYILDFASGLPLKMGMHVPKDGNGTGTLYVVQGELLLTVTLRDIAWKGSEMTAVGKVIRGAGATIPMGIRATVNDAGEMTGKMYIGSVPAAGVEPKGPVLSFTGKRREEPRAAGGR